MESRDPEIHAVRSSGSSDNGPGRGAAEVLPDQDWVTVAMACPPCGQMLHSTVKCICEPVKEGGCGPGQPEDFIGDATGIQTTVNPEQAGRWP